MSAEAFRRLVPEDLEARLEEGLRGAAALGAAGAEAFVTVSRSRRAKVQNGALEDLTASRRGGLGVRILRPGPGGLRAGLASTSDLAAADFAPLFRRAWDLADLADPDPWLRQADPEGGDDLPPRHDPRVDALTPEDGIRRALALESGAREASGRVAAVREAAWSDGAGATLLLSSRGVRAWDAHSTCSASVELAVERDGDRQAAWHWAAARHPEAPELADVGREAALKGERKLGPEALPAGRYPVVLHPEVAVDLLGIVADMLAAEAVLRGRSLFAGRMGLAVASPALTLVDDGRLPGGLGTRPWDDEGLPTRRTVLIEDGVLRSHLHTLRSAAEMGQAPTASAGRGIGSQPAAATSNLHLRAGSRPAADLLREAEGGILITEIMGLHTVNPVSGDLSVGASGLRIRDGAAAGAVDRLTFAGNLRDLLLRIVAVGDDLRWYGAGGGASLLLEPLSLGGA